MRVILIAISESSLICRPPRTYAPQTAPYLYCGFPAGDEGAGFGCLPSGVSLPTSCPS